MIVSPFRNINRLFVQSLEAGENDPTSNSFDKHYRLLLKLKDLNALIDNKPFFEEPIRNKQEAYENPVEILRNNDYTTGSFRLFVPSKSLSTHWHRFIKQKMLKRPKKINFTGKLE